MYKVYSFNKFIALAVYLPLMVYCEELSYKDVFTEWKDNGILLYYQLQMLSHCFAWLIKDPSYLTNWIVHE